MTLLWPLRKPNILSLHEVDIWAWTFGSSERNLDGEFSASHVPAWVVYQIAAHARRLDRWVATLLAMTVGGTRDRAGSRAIPGLA